jgi:enoyl-CoA hydratase/carnithine racemase
MPFQNIIYEIKDYIATVTINRPDKMNSLNDDVTNEIREAMYAAGDDKGVRVIILTGAGRAFCAGGDITGFGNIDPKELPAKPSGLFDMNRRPDYQSRHVYFPAISKPIIAMINGAVAGMGLLYALCCDIRVAAEDAVFTTAFSRIGLAAEYGVHWMLSLSVGHARALELLISGRRFYGPEALRIGLVSHLYSQENLVRETYAYADEIARLCSPLSTRMIKKQMYEAPFKTLAEAVIEANQDMIICNSSSDFKEGQRAFMEKRVPKFTGK